MDWEVVKGSIAGIIRANCAAVVGYLIAKGYLSEENVTLAIGIIASAAVVVLSSIWNKIKARFFAEAASDLPANADATEIKTLANEKLADVSVITKVLP